jgi:PAS domain S-box-containing protein
MFLSLASSASDAILMIGNNGLISFWNPAAEKIFGRSSQEVYDQPFTLVFAPESLPNDWPSDYKGMPDFIRNNPASASFFELLGIRSSGEQFPTEVSISPVHIDDYWHATFIVRDISERKQREADLIKARENAEEASMARQRFLSVMSHEIRTPLNGIIGTANLLAQEDPREDQKEYLETLVFSGNHLLSLINDILDFSKIEANKIEFERLDFNLKELVSGVLKIFDYKAADKGISLTAELDTQIPTFLKGDTVRLNQILTNLIGNAIKFTEKGEVKVLVKTKNLSESSITCKFEIIDTGIGIPQDKIHTIFDLFSQADTNTTRKFGGTGLGLAITQKLIELQRGKINVQSEVGHGSNFTFELTFNRSSKKIEPNSTTVDNLKSLEGMKVLLVEDNKINQMIATKFLMRWNAQVTLAENGLEALERVQQQKHDIVLMDLQMPLMDGYEAAAQIRKLDGIHYQKIPIIALTASALIEVKEGITRAGMNDIVSKPFIPDELNNKIFEYVNKS